VTSASSTHVLLLLILLHDLSPIYPTDSSPVSLQDEPHIYPTDSAPESLQDERPIYPTDSAPASLQDEIPPVGPLWGLYRGLKKQIHEKYTIVIY
jgi:hypothetical protein